MWHASSMCARPHSYVKWLIHIWHHSFICDMPDSYVKWLIHMSHDSFIVTSRICLWHELIHVTWLIHLYIPTHFFINHSPSRARKYAPRKIIAQNHNTFILCCSNWHICTHPYIPFFFWVQIWEAACWKRPVRDLHTQRVRRCVSHGFAVCCSVLQCGTVWCSVLQVETSYQKRPTAHHIRHIHHQKTHVCYLICAQYAIQTALQPSHSYLLSNYPYLSSNYGSK